MEKPRTHMYNPWTLSKEGGDAGERDGTGWRTIKGRKKTWTTVIE